MIILASTSNDKGAQLETLTQRILRHRGYINCTTNVLAGGAELDVRGQVEIPQIGEPRMQTLICECKAHKTAVDMTQWCKFLGKVYFQEACERTTVLGCFISLSGVNGHVQGHYDEIRRHRNNISMIHGDELLRIIGEFLTFEPLDHISARVHAMTNRAASRYEPAYHEGNIYWVVVFSAGDFTILSADGSALHPDVAALLSPMIESELDVATFVDLQEEFQAIERAILARVLVVATVFNMGGSTSGIDAFEGIEDFSPQELTEAAQRLVDEGHLTIDADGRCNIPVTDTDDGPYVSADLYSILFATPFPVGVLESDFYKRHINRALLRRICEIQCSLPLPEEDIDEIIGLLRLSPSALGRSLQPMQMIVHGRRDGESNEQVDRFHLDYFRQTALEALKRDFRSSNCANFYHEICGIRELEATTRLVLKSDTRIEKEDEFTERIAIGRAAESLGGGLVHVALLRDAPQPWEQRSPIASVEPDETETQ